MSGYKPCACRDCFETAIGDDDEAALCNACEEAGCDPDEECQALHAYCSGGETSEGLCEDCGSPF